MATSFIEIYDRAIAEIDDPTITKTYNNSPTDFFKIMYTYLNNAIPSFNNPMSISSSLSKRQIPQNQIELFTGDGTNKVFSLSSTPLNNSFFEYMIQDNVVGATYNGVTNSVTFSYIPFQSANVSIEWYYVGEFTDNLTDIVKKILSKLLVLSWAEKEKNFLLDIRRLVNNTDFKLNDSAAATRSKGGWYEAMREESEKIMNQYAYSLMFPKRGV